MANAISALNHIKFQGEVLVEEMGLCGMITLRADLSSSKVRSAIKKHLGCDVPDQRKINVSKTGRVAWMSVDELLLIVNYQDADKITDALIASLSGLHHLVVNVSDARALFSVTGEGIRDVFAKAASIDLSKEAFQMGDFRRTRMSQIAAAFWLSEENQIEVICFRSVAEYLFNLLSQSAKKGSLPNYF